MKSMVETENQRRGVKESASKYVEPDQLCIMSVYVREIGAGIAF